MYLAAQSSNVQGESGSKAIFETLQTALLQSRQTRAPIILSQKARDEGAVAKHIWWAPEHRRLTYHFQTPSAVGRELLKSFPLIKMQQISGGHRKEGLCAKIGGEGNFDPGGAVQPLCPGPLPFTLLKVAQRVGVSHT